MTESQVGIDINIVPDPEQIVQERLEVVARAHERHNDERIARGVSPHLQDLIEASTRHRYVHANETPGKKPSGKPGQPKNPGSPDDSGPP